MPSVPRLPADRSLVNDLRVAEAFKNADDLPALSTRLEATDLRKVGAARSKTGRHNLIELSKIGH